MRPGYGFDREREWIKYSWDHKHDCDTKNKSFLEEVPSDRFGCKTTSTKQTGFLFLHTELKR